MGTLQSCMYVDQLIIIIMAFPIMIESLSRSLSALGKKILSEYPIQLKMTTQVSIVGQRGNIHKTDMASVGVDVDVADGNWIGVRYGRSLGR